MMIYKLIPAKLAVLMFVNSNISKFNEFIIGIRKILVNLIKMTIVTNYISCYYNKFDIYN